MSNIADIYERQVEKAINDWGRNVSIIYGSTAVCNSCGYDPVNREATNISCSTCDGLYYYKTENTWLVKGVLKNALINMRYLDSQLLKQGYVPDYDARLTCWLDDVLVDTDSSTGATYLDQNKNIRVEIDGNKYVIKSTTKTGVEDLKVIISVLREIK